MTLPKLTVAQISFEPVFGWYVAIALGLIMLASLWLTITAHGISRRRRVLLMSLRLAAVAVLLLGWLRPGFISSTERESAGAIAVLLDRSQSMTLPSGYENRNRWEIQQEVWEELVSQTDLKIGESQIIPFFYDGRPFAADANDLPRLRKSFTQAPNGRQTDLGKTLQEIGRMQIDPPLRAVVLAGDATQTVIPPEADASIVARQMAQLDQPILMVGIGPTDEKSQVRDVAIEGLPEHYMAFIKKELSVRFVVNAQGMQNQPIQIKLRMRSDGRDEIIAAREVLASRARERMPLEFKVVVPTEGEYLLEVSAEVEAREQIESNNLALSFLTVREGGVKILYLEGQPRQEQLFLKRSLNESLDFDVQYAWFPQRQRSTWPINLVNRVNLNDYDAIILGDLDSGALSDATLRSLASRVRNGGGLLIMGGYHSFDAGGYGTTLLAPLFPVELSRRRQQFDRPIDRSFHIEGEIRMEPTRPHPITTLMNEPDNTQLWQNLKPLQGINRLGRLRSNLGTQVLLRSPTNEPIMVASESVRGRVLAFAGDTTWQWWLSGHKKIHQQFWRQALLWLVNRDSLNEGFGLELDSRRLLIDETPDLQIEWFGGGESKPMPQTVRVVLTREGRVLQRLTTQAEGDNKLSAKIIGLSEPGLYKAKLEANDADGTPYESEIAFIVRDESRELARPAADLQMMKNIVSANETAGGKLYAPDSVAEIVSFLRERQDATKVTTVEKRRLGDAAWDAWLYLVLFCLLMSAEWGLRKSWQLP